MGTRKCQFSSCSRFASEGFTITDETSIDLWSHYLQVNVECGLDSGISKTSSVYRQNADAPRKSHAFTM